MTPQDELRAAAKLLRENPDGPDRFEANIATSLWIAIHSDQIPASMEEWLTSAADRWNEIRGHWESVHALVAARAVARAILPAAEAEETR